ncbi:MAG: TldD/PmbA family protein [Acidobacteriia bacterium]|nr:TldD/PmbA family protein [Terriglobia bacterium]
MADLKQLAVELVHRAIERRAAAADCLIVEGDDFSVTVRRQQIETLKESGSKGLGLRVFVRSGDGARLQTATSHTSDLSETSLARLLEDTVALARITSPDECAGLPEKEWIHSLAGELGIYSDSIALLDTDQKIRLARDSEKFALDFDPRIVNSDGSSFSSSLQRVILANSSGFAGEYQSSGCSLNTVSIAAEKAPDGSGAGSMQRDGWYSNAVDFARLETPEVVGTNAAKRTLSRLGARKISTCEVPVIFDPLTARSLLENLVDAVSGNSIYRHASFLVGRLGNKVASECVSVIDDGLMSAGLGTSPFDGEGVPSQTTPIIEHGILKNYLLNCYAARKLGLRTTANATRDVSGSPRVGPTNFYLKAGTRPPSELIQSVERGVYVTDLIGFGVNVVTGDYSRGASGLWIENGELTFPFEEVTIAGNLAEMLLSIEAVANDEDFRDAVASPSIKISKMMVSGS